MGGDTFFVTHLLPCGWFFASLRVSAVESALGLWLRLRQASSRRDRPALPTRLISEKTFAVDFLVTVAKLNCLNFEYA